MNYNNNSSYITYGQDPINGTTVKSNDKVKNVSNLRIRFWLVQQYWDHFKMSNFPKYSKIRTWKSIGYKY